MYETFFKLKYKERLKETVSVPFFYITRHFPKFMNIVLPISTLRVFKYVPDIYI